jgi:acetyl esterase/lipase
MITPLSIAALASILDQPGYAPCPGVEIEIHRAIGAAPARPGEKPHELHVTIFRPTQRPAAPTPALVAFHGGGFQFGTPEGCGALAKTLALTLGITTIAPSYRLATEETSTFPGLLDDALHSWRWVQENAAELHIDPTRVAVSGESAGTLLAMHLAVASPFISCKPDENKPAAFVCLWGPIDFVARWFDLNESHGPERELLGAHYFENPAIYHQASPLAHAHGKLPPALFIYGRQDRLVSPRQGRLGLAAWQAAACHGELQVIQNIGHETVGDTRDATISMLRKATVFLSARLPTPQLQTLSEP